MKRAFTLIEAVIIVGFLFLLAAFLYPIFARARYGDPTMRCASNLKQMGLGVLQYIQDYDDRFPLAHSTATTGWGNDIYPYLKSYFVFQCPKGAARIHMVTSSPSSPTAVLFTSDYFYNRRLDKVQEDKITSRALTILVGDGPADAPSWSNQMGLPADAVTNSASPAWRHSESAGRGAYYLFTDGHVKLLAPDQISNASVQNNTPTFAVK